MAKNQAQAGWTFNLDNIKNKENLKEPLGYKSSTTDIVVRDAGRRNLTQQEVLENVSIYTL